MSSQDQEEDRSPQGNANPHSKRPPNEQADISAGSPDGSQASQSSSTTRRNAQRIVELLPELISRQTESAQSDGGQENWVIGAEFYHEDIGAEDERMSQEIEDEVGDQEMDDEIDADDLDEVNEDYFDEEVDDDDDDDYDDDDMGFVLAPFHNDSDTDDDDEYEESDDVEECAANFDTTLPIAHGYLGELVESGGTQMFAENSILSMPLFNISTIVLLPGQELPIKATATHIYESLRDLIGRGTTLIGLMSRPRENPTGTTAEIRGYRQEESEFILKLEGRQRFQLLSKPFETFNLGTVKILPEIGLGRPYLLPPSRRKLLLGHDDHLGKIVTSRHPLWLLKKYESTNMVKNILDKLPRVKYPVDLKSRNPSDLSYWVAANFPFSNQQRMALLEFNCTEQRLLWLQEHLEAGEYLGCFGCGNVISTKKHMITMSRLGFQTSFMNDYGIVHDLLTVRATRGLIRELEWSTDCPWFPGYKWSVVSCDTCNRHIGWCYKSLSSDTMPRKFYGLSRANVRLQSYNNEDERVYE